MITERMIQALGAALSRKDWHATEVAYAHLRDAEFEARTKAVAEAPAGPEPLPGWVLMPIEPTREMLYAIASPEFPNDHDAGVKAAARLGGDVIPAVYEVEEAYGQYQRVLAMAPAPPVEPVRWLSTLHIEGNQTDEVVTRDCVNGHGKPGKDYSEECPVTIEPLFRYPPAVPPGEIVEWRYRWIGDGPGREGSWKPTFAFDNGLDPAKYEQQPLYAGPTCTRAPAAL